MKQEIKSIKKDVLLSTAVYAIFALLVGKVLIDMIIKYESEDSKYLKDFSVAMHQSLGIAVSASSFAAYRFFSKKRKVEIDSLKNDIENEETGIALKTFRIE